MVPFDSSEHSKRALLTSIEIAKKFNGKLTVFHVYSPAVPPIGGPESAGFASTSAPVIDPINIARAIDAAREAGRQILDRVSKLLRPME
jgi:nucleotide-binding universal stress UspA family protein